MRLFLASQDFGNHADRLSAMVGVNCKALASGHKEENSKGKRD